MAAAAQRPTHELRIQALEQWRNGNGALGAEKRLQLLEKNAMLKDQIPGAVDYAIRKYLREEHKAHSADWNKWVNTGLLVVAIAMLAVSLWG